MDKELEEIRMKKMKALEKKQFGKPVEVTDNTFDELVGSNPAVVVDFWAEWCAPCRLMGPVIEELAKKYSGKIVFGKLNVDKNSETPPKHNIAAIPTLLFFKNGRVVDQVVGFVPSPQLDKKLLNIL
ncbi:MAG: thioredoxin [Candidatus Hadarchaeota archaeon]